ncbi:MAG TPA: efflux RND transporter periplasmic adaptor subunit [Rudaea sp.]|nr:efflux RND transporter periplasmic adaptor subunit [Rudaea sp.]
MNATRLIFAMLLGLALGIGATWLALHRAAGTIAPATAEAPTPAGRKVLYWYDPMVPDRHFDKPGKSPFMDMQLVPKYASGSAAGTGIVDIDPREVQNLGVRTAQAERGTLNFAVRATGTVAFDERAVTVVQARVAGIVERLDVRAPLTEVRQGQPLLTLLAPDWTAAQEDYLSLRRSHAQGLDALRAAARERLVLLGMSEVQIRSVEQRGQAQTRITVTAPRAGVIGELSVREGASVMAGAPLLRINGLDTVWINAAIPEAQVGRMSATSAVEAELQAYPGERFAGRIEALLPDIDAATRTQTARIVLDNPGHRLAPGMFARVEIAASKQAAGVLVPTDAVIATGTRNVVIVADGQGRFRAQEVRIGDEANGKTQILDGVSDGERVVQSGQFLIDSEASLSGTLARLQGGTDAQPAPVEPAGSKP